MVMANILKIIFIACKYDDDDDYDKDFVKKYWFSDMTAITINKRCCAKISN